MYTWCLTNYILQMAKMPRQDCSLQICSYFCRATYVAEETASRTEKAAARQDAFIDGLHARLRAARASRDLASARAAEQRTETRSARELLAATAAEVEAVHWERRARGSQWRDSLLAVQRRDEALKVRPLKQQHRQGLSYAYRMLPVNHSGSRSRGYARAC